MGHTKFFFSVKKPTQEDKDVLINFIINNELDKAAIFINKIRNTIVFGELKDGEQFLFHNNGLKYYQPNEDSIREFLMKDDRMIVDTSGTEVPTDYIWELVDENQEKLNASKKLETASDEEKALADLEDIEYYKKEIQKYSPKYGEFYNDNLRFSALV